MRSCVRIVGLSAALLVAFGLVGCGESSVPEGMDAPIPVTGLLTIDGEPFGPVGVRLNPTDVNLSNSGGQADKTGTVTFSTFGPGDGIPAGEYTATLVGDMLEPKPIPNVAPLPITITEEDAGTQIDLAFVSTGGMTETGLPRRPPGGDL